MHKHGSTLALLVCVSQGVFVFVGVFVCVGGCVCVGNREKGTHYTYVGVRNRENFAAGIKSSFCGLPKWAATKSARDRWIDRERDIYKESKRERDKN